jgi:Type III flagellar switch regulator (C-ring) FliN C-term
MDPLYNFLEKLEKTSINKLSGRGRAINSITGSLKTLSLVLKKEWSINSIIFENSEIYCMWYPLKNGFLGISHENMKLVSNILFKNEKPEDSLNEFSSLYAVAISQVFLSYLINDRTEHFKGPLGKGFEEYYNNVYKLCVEGSGEKIYLYWYPDLNSWETFESEKINKSYKFNVSIIKGFLDLSKLENFNVGDVILPGWENNFNYYIGKHPCWIPSSYDGVHLKSHGDWLMKSSFSNEIPLEVIVEVGRMRIKGEDLDSFVQGAVIPLGSPPKGEVNLVCDGKIIGNGELVIAGDELGIKLTKILF